MFGQNTSYTCVWWSLKPIPELCYKNMLQQVKFWVYTFTRVKHTIIDRSILCSLHWCFFIGMYCSDLRFGAFCDSGKNRHRKPYSAKSKICPEHLVARHSKSSMSPTSTTFNFRLQEIRISSQGLLVWNMIKHTDIGS